MRRYVIASVTSAAFCVATLTALTAGTTQAADWGTLSGQFVFEGEIPAAAIEVTGGKDPEVCKQGELKKGDLVINKESKGVGNVFIYLRKTKAVHPDLAASKKSEIAFDQKGCEFKPHAMFVRTDQTVMVMSDDPIAHNTHTYTIKNQPVNFLVPGVNRKGIPVKKTVAEILPMQVKCDVHPWMKAYWLILDHPYAAVSDKDGKFKIENLPEGDHEFRVWHERVGYVDVGGPKKGRLNVIVKKGMAPLKPFKLDIKKLTDEDDA